MSADTNGNEHQRRDQRIASVANPASQQTVGRKPCTTQASSHGGGPHETRRHAADIPPEQPSVVNGLGGFMQPDRRVPLAPPAALR